jgi:hypothetical protein
MRPEEIDRLTRWCAAEMMIYPDHVKRLLVERQSLIETLQEIAALAEEKQDPMLPSGVAAIGKYAKNALLEIER